MHIDDQSPISGTSEPGATELNTDGVLWIGLLFVAKKYLGY
jgi:hypothetical protein